MKIYALMAGGTPVEKTVHEVVWLLAERPTSLNCLEEDLEDDILKSLLFTLARRKCSFTGQNLSVDSNRLYVGIFL